MSDESSQWLSANIVAIVVIVIVVGITTFVCTIIAKLAAYKIFQPKSKWRSRRRKRNETVLRKSDTDSSDSYHKNNQFRQWYDFKAQLQQQPLLTHQEFNKLRSFGSYIPSRINNNFQRTSHGNRCYQGAEEAPCYPPLPRILDGNLRMSPPATPDSNLSRKLGLGNDRSEPFDTFMRQLEDENLTPMQQTPPRLRDQGFSAFNNSRRFGVPVRKPRPPGFHQDSDTPIFRPKMKPNLFVRLENEFNNVVSQISTTGSDSVFHHHPNNNVRDVFVADVHQTAGSFLSKSRTTPPSSKQISSENYLGLPDEQAEFKSPASVYFSPEANDVAISRFPSHEAELILVHQHPGSNSPDVVPLLPPPSQTSPSTHWHEPGRTGPTPNTMGSKFTLSSEINLSGSSAESNTNNISSQPPVPTSSPQDMKENGPDSNSNSAKVLTSPNGGSGRALESTLSLQKEMVTGGNNLNAPLNSPNSSYLKSASKSSNLVKMETIKSRLSPSKGMAIGDSGQLMVLGSVPNHLLPGHKINKKSDHIKLRNHVVRCVECGHDVKSSEVTKNGGSESTILKWLKFSSGHITKKKFRPTRATMSPVSAKLTGSGQQFLV